MSFVHLGFKSQRSNPSFLRAFTVYSRCRRAKPKAIRLITGKVLLNREYVYGLLNWIIIIIS